MSKHESHSLQTFKIKCLWQLDENATLSRFQITARGQVKIIISICCIFISL